MERIERTALSNLIHNEEYTRKVLPFIKEEYFSDRTERLLFTEIYKFSDVLGFSCSFFIFLMPCKVESCFWLPKCNSRRGRCQGS